MNTISILDHVEKDQTHKTFYPTPDALADKLLKDIDWMYVQSVLEPSAGKGDLAKYIARKMYNKRKGYIPYDEHSAKEAIEESDIDCIEIDTVLRGVLDGQGFRVTHDDFLTFETQKRYSHIVMNPPFNDGDKHLLKAIELQRRGGCIACILNAETIRNPYSTTRQRLMKELDSYGATIRYVENAFSDAERKTDVDVALITVTIPQVKIDSTIMDDMRKAPTYKTQEIPEQYFDIVQYNQIDEWVNRYNYEVACGIRLIDEYEAMRPFILNNPGETYASPILSIKLHTEGGHDKDTAINEYIRETRGKYWRMIFQQKTIIEKLTNNLVQELQDNVRRLMDYDFSAYNILTLIIKMNGKVVNGIESTILELFEEWTGKYHYSETTSNRHYYDGWKTNDCFAVGKKVIIPFYGAYDGWFDHKFRAYNVTQKFGDIEKVFSFLDNGRTNWEGTLEATMRLAEATENTRNIDTRFFTATFYKKGTAHLVFKDEELLEKFNLYAGQRKGWLPPTYGKKHYKDMSEEEKHVIDSFQGRERYEHVMKNADYYLNDGNKQLLIGTGV